MNSRAIFVSLLVSLFACGGSDPAADASTDISSSDTPSQDMAQVEDMATVDASSPAPRFEQYIRADEKQSLVFHLHAFADNAPSASVRSAFTTWVGAQVDKPSGVRFEDGTTLDAHANPWTVDELVALANANLAEDPANEVSINVYYVDGTFERDGVLGAAFTDRDLVIFRETLESNCDGGVLGGDSCDIGEESILRHEFGHLLGLVNRGLPQVEDHEDPDHPGHEVQEGCLMYFALETASGLFGGLLGGGEPVDFCAASKADIEALRTR